MPLTSLSEVCKQSGYHSSQPLSPSGMHCTPLLKCSIHLKGTPVISMTSSCYRIHTCTKQNSIHTELLFYRPVHKIILKANLYAREQYKWLSSTIAFNLKTYFWSHFNIFSMSSQSKNYVHKQNPLTFTSYSSVIIT